jgi:hypothetical protein
VIDAGSKQEFSFSYPKEISAKSSILVTFDIESLN